MRRQQQRVLPTVITFYFLETCNSSDLWAKYVAKLAGFSTKVMIEKNPTSLGNVLNYTILQGPLIKVVPNRLREEGL